jgi:LacI family transcriptional regulator
MGHERKKVTIKDVAYRSGVSIGAVSRVLQGRSSTIRISAATAERIRNAAKELGYEPNQMAQSLRSGKTNHVVLGSTDNLNLQGADGVLVNELLEAFEPNGLSLLLTKTLIGQADSVKTYRGQFDAVVWIGDPSDVPHHTLSSIRVPLVYFPKEGKNGKEVADRLIQILTSDSV